MESKPGLLKNLIFSVLALLLFFGTLEILARILFDTGIRGERVEVEYEVDSDILWYNKPDQHVVQISKGIDYSINSKGLRCADFPLKKPEDEIRLLIIGDSVTLGYRVPEDQAYPQVLNGILQERFPGTRIRVINGGVNAYSTREELMFLRKKGIGFEPDIVIVGFVLNDVSLIIRQHYLEMFEKLRMEGTTELRLKGIYRILQRSRFITSLGRILKSIRMRAGDREDTRQFQITLHHKELIAIDKKEIEEGWDRSMGELEEMSDLLREYRIKMVVAQFPIKLQLEEMPTPDKPQKRVREFCETNEATCIDLLPSFLENKDSPLFIDRVHLTPEGYRLAAEQIGVSLIAHDLLQGG